MNTKTQKVNFTWSLNTLESLKNCENLRIPDIKKSRSKNINKISEHMQFVKTKNKKLFF